MGCETTKEKLQIDILVLQLEKAEIEEQRESLIYQLNKLNCKKNNSSSTTKTTNENEEQ